MPSIKTHYFFAKQRYDQDVMMLPFLRFQADVVFLTAQGPDPFMFYGYVPWRKRKQIQVIRELASALHNQKELILAKFSSFFAYASQKKDEEKEVLHAAIYGELTHYFLDSRLHPYVFYRTGYQEGIDADAYFYDHGRFESMMDTELERHFQKRISPTSILHCPDYKLNWISVMYASTCNQIASTTYKEAVKDMRMVERVLRDRFSLKKKLLFMLGLKHHQAYALSHFYRKPKKDTIDYLNDKKQTWLYPDTGEVSQASIVDLIQQANVDFEGVLPLFQRFSSSELTKYLGQKSYDGVGYGKVFLHSQSVYTK